jgi:hypothetical protein
MIYEFRWEDILNGQVRRRERKEGPFVSFDLPDLAPTENLRIILLDNENHGAVVGEILLQR